ncbi:hypothetical protein A3A70_02940 [candidate division WWE3 bacterium RIFCSPLOWO2_01_FULL_42_11]|uniref:Uncharacterized protein n=2 Tax=Bacteria candidate phyla TaxID=1783234 RepID=A0A1F5ZTP2_9BACT|nr:MAG: hypothetical protein A3A70_02940 [candidate division WWE3 bacterium RIFCSPLOWO2_01_FULL_42_11]OGG15457.1 MAG: hypothetical protein A2875_04195 [Candidatus Gottesmanbacteria bacterium RIFCSPHIGHO2_01_FULL_46_14]
MKNGVNTSFSNKQPVQITPEMEKRMRLMANLIIDRIYEDKKNHTLKFQSNSNKQYNASITGVKMKENTS